MYCKKCGKEIPDNEELCLDCRVEEEKKVGYCTSCGAPLEEGASFCKTCGSKVDSFTKPVVKQVVETDNGPVIPGYDQKSRLAAGLLGIFLGCYGVHNFYLGYTGRAVAQLVCTIVGYILSCIFIGVFLVAGIGIWALVESIMIFAGGINVDGKGYPLKD